MIKMIQIYSALGLLSLAAFGTLPVCAETNLIQDGGFENASQTDLKADYVAPEGNVWGTNSYEFTATDTTTTIIVQNTSPMTGRCCAPTINDVRVFSVIPELN